MNLPADHLKQATGSLGGDQIPEDLRKRYEYAVEQVRNMDAKPVLKKAYQQTYAQYRQESEDIERIAKAEAALAQKTRECEELKADDSRLLAELHTALKMIDPKSLQSTRDYAIELTRKGHYENKTIKALEAQVEQLGRQVAEMDY